MVKYLFLLISSLSFSTTLPVSKNQTSFQSSSGPLLTVYGNLVNIVNGDITPSYVDNTTFLSCQVINETNSMTYMMVNDGDTPLTISNILVSGLNSSDFQITSVSSYVILAGENASFTVLFDPSAVGLRNATIQVISDDLLNPLYNFSIEGTGLDYIECGYNSSSEVVLNQDFEVNTTFPIWNYTIASGNATVNGGTAYAENGVPLPLVSKFIGTKSLQINNSNCIILFDPVNTLNIRDASFNFRLASFSKTPSEGSENGDYVSVAVSTNGGNSWSNEVEITGSSQAKWSFLSGVGVAQTTYSGTDFIVSFTPNLSGFLTNEGYSVVRLTGLPKTSDLRIRLTVVNNNINEIWAIDDVSLLARKQASTIWNGVQWTNGVPNNYTKAIIDANYSTLQNGNIVTCKCQINSGSTLSVDTNSFLSSESDINNYGSLVVEDGGTIIQKDDFATNTGNATIKRNATIRKLDYVYWSSPLKQFLLNSISLNTSSNFLWKWNPIINNPNGGLGYWINASAEVMETGKGYIVRGPDNFNSIPQTFSTSFSGSTINNGLISRTISRGAMTSSTLPNYTSSNGVPFSIQDDNWNLVGNPYPSALNVDSFLEYNAINNPVIEGSVRLWTHGTLPTSNVNPFYNSYQYNYTANDYITYNGTATLSGPNGFNGFIASCQGFFVLMNEGNQADAQVIFNNSMRVNMPNSNMQFYRSQFLTPVTEKHRIWLDLVNDSGFATRTVVGYLNNATNEKDVLYDAFTKLDGNQNFYSLIDDQKVCIQGRPLPFDINDSLDLGFSVSVSGNYTIAIGALDGLFLNNQEIYIEDKLLHITHNLKQSPYQFYSSSGTYDHRFSLKYQNNLALENVSINTNVDVVVNSNANSISLKTNDLKMNSIVVYDLLGRLLLEKNNINSDSFMISELFSSRQSLMLKIRLENGVSLVKKIIY